MISSELLSGHKREHRCPRHVRIREKRTAADVWDGVRRVEETGSRSWSQVEGREGEASQRNSCFDPESQCHVVPIQIPTSTPPQSGIFEPHTRPTRPEGYHSSLLCEIIARLVLFPCGHPVRNVTTHPNEHGDVIPLAPKSRTSASPVLALPSR